MVDLMESDKGVGPDDLKGLLQLRHWYDSISQLANNCPSLQASLSFFLLHAYISFSVFLIHMSISLFLKLILSLVWFFTLSFICMYMHKFTIDMPSKSVPPSSEDNVSSVSWLCPQEFSPSVCHCCQLKHRPLAAGGFFYPGVLFWCPTAFQTTSTCSLSVHV